jgi:hypothetical protein
MKYARHKLNEPSTMTGFCLLMATAWLVLGNHSDNVPWGSDLFWVIMCSVAAGAALAVAKHRSIFALRSYVFISATIGAIRSAAYLSDNSGGPAAVWFLLTLTTIGGYLLYVDRLERRT